MPMPEHLRALDEAAARTRMPADFAARWQARRAGTVSFTQTPHPALSSGRLYAQEIVFSAAGRCCPARLLAPRSQPPQAVVLELHDIGRGVRGWHHLMRYPAFGFAVLAPEYLPSTLSDFCPDTAADRYETALAAAALAKQLYPSLPLYCVGEGLGGALALAAAALEEAEKCAVLNPLLADFRTVCTLERDTGFYAALRDHFRVFDPTHRQEEEFFTRLDYLDAANFARLLRGSLLLGVGLLDEISPPACQLAVWQAASGPKARHIFPKYGHERINFYENEQLSYLLSGGY